MKERNLYEGKVEMTFNPNNHQYKINGKAGQVSVTAVTGMLNKPNLIQWAADLSAIAGLEADKISGIQKEYEQMQKMTDWEKKRKAKLALDIKYPIYKEVRLVNKQKKDNAAKSGTKVHDWCEQYILHKIKGGEEPEKPKDKEILNGVLAFLDWMNERKVKFLATEMLVYSKKYKYCGLMDCKVKIGKTIHCLDLKTSSGIWNEMFYQVSAYQEADAEESGTEYGSTFILRLDKETGEFESHTIPVEDHVKNFKAFTGLLAVKRREAELK